jgi:FMN phosphatase YigB (HAD superfamily)
MKKISAIIFDMDGTLYSFDNAVSQTFAASKLRNQIRENCVRFFEKRFSLTPDKALAMLQDLDDRYPEGTSLAVEKEYGVDRYEFFEQTWNILPDTLIAKNELLLPALQRLQIPVGVLTAAPRIWADKALAFLEIDQIFSNAVFTGEPDIRKPNSLAFQQLVDFWKLPPTEILAIGDQEESDIIPAKSLGMMTLKVGAMSASSADFQAENVVSAIELLQTKGLI